MTKQSATLSRRYSMNLGDRQTGAFLLKKMSAIKSLTVLPDGRLHLTFGNLPVMPFADCSINSIAIIIPEDIGQFIDYDIVDYYYPLVSHRFIYELCSEDLYFINELDFRLYKKNHYGHFVRDWQFYHYESEGLSHYRSWYAFDSMVYKNNKITVCIVDQDYFPYVSANQRYLSIDLRKRKNKYSIKEFSIIIPLQDEFRDNFIFVVEGKITREEMDEIYLLVSEKYN